MSSLLAYGQGFLSEDIWSGAGISEPWAQYCGWGEGESSSVNGEGESSASKSSGGEASEGGLSQFFSVIQAAAPPEALSSPKVLIQSSTKKELHWDSPPQSPSTVFVHLPYSVLSIISTGTKADAVVVGLFQQGSECALETLLYLPKGLSFAEYIVFKPDLLGCVNGKVCSTEMLDLPPEFSNALKKRPQSFLGLRFSLEKYTGIIFGLWCDGSKIPATAAAVFSDAVQSLPMLLSNRINARKYERLGKRFDAILKVIPDAVLFVDDECAQVVLNPAAAALLGLPNHGEVEPSKVAVAMRALTERCKGRTDPQHWMRLLSSDEEVEIEEDWELTAPRRVLHVRSYPVTSHTAHGRLWIYADVTAERDAEEAIEAANRAKSQFLAMMSHELRTPMTGVLGMLDLLYMTNLESEQHGLVKIMQESAEGLMEVINNILDYCKIEAGRLELEEIDFSLRDTFEQIQSMVKTSFLQKELKLTISGEPSGRTVVRGDPVRLRQVLLNIVSNAIKFTEEGGINVSWRFLDPQWVDTTVVAMSQSSSGKSKLINQIINASRGEKCSVEHLTTPTGRSVIVVNCSSAGAAGPYLETSLSSSTRPVPLAPAPPKQSQPEGSSSTSNESSPSDLPTLSTSFPVLYSVGPENRPVSEVFQSADIRHQFVDRKSLAGSEPQRTPSYSDLASTLAGKEPQTTPSLSDLASSLVGKEPKRTPSYGELASILAGKEPQRTPSFSDLASQVMRAISDESETPPRFIQKPLIKDPAAGSDEAEFRSSKYQKLSSEKSSGSNLQGSASPVVKDRQPELIGKDLGVIKTPLWHSGPQSLSPASPQLNLGRVPLKAADSSTVKTGDRIIQHQRVSLQRPHVCAGDLSSSDEEVKSDAVSSMEESKKAGPTSGLKFCKKCKSALYEDDEPKGGSKPEEKVWLEVTVSDTGVGIGKEQLDRLFVGSHAGSQRRNAAGTGLGLAICKGLLCLMNGKIQMESKIGDGTTVILTVPLLPAAEAVQELVEELPVIASTSAVAPSAASGVTSIAEPESHSIKDVLAETKTPEALVSGRKGPDTKAIDTKATQAKATPTKATGSKTSEASEQKKIKVLVAEDNRVNQLLIRKMFQHLGHKVIKVEIVGNGKLAVEAVQKTCFDLVLMDVQMPILDGLSATKAIRALPPPTSQIPIHALSADTPGSGPIEETGLDGYLKKPIAWDMMSQLISQILAAKSGVS